ncbi:hypothetical protein AC578_8280 [Pseudocercospora eumusae]|uniref:Uncharacterized protein n=1 Tax=Pseudocercospora eumusae TaxID=321146 RepID=A0A139GU43_9PEZI|nr:hypothetical protein AC578_8280 [Pseudocercospora eumusae]KXS93717.1 hypothetical protein AC578_8280 [Pseudocercospora eumusae]
MTSLGTKCVKDTMSAPHLEQGLSTTDGLPENSRGYAGMSNQRAELMRKEAYRTTRAVTMITFFCVGLLLVYHSFTVQSVTQSLDSSAGISQGNDTGHAFWNQDTNVDITVKTNINTLAGQVAVAEIIPDESYTADPKHHQSGCSSGAVSSHSSTGLVKRSGVDAASQQERTLETRSAQADKGKTPAYLAPPAPQGHDSSSPADTSSSDEAGTLESLGGRLTYEQAVAKGIRYIQLMKQQPKSKDEARLWTEKEIKDQGWVDHSEAGKVVSPSGIATLLKSFAPQFITTLEPDWRHTNKIAGSFLKKPILPTQAFYQQIINARAGVIFITNAHGPQKEGAKRSRAGSRLPELQHLSDFSYMAWSEAAKASKRSRKTLQKVVRCSIDNKDTKHIIARVTKEAQPGSLPYSRRMSFKAGSEQYSALLGTENGVGVAYLLAKHQTTLGWKVIDSIEVFYDQGFAYIVFNIRDVTPKSDKSGAAGPSKSFIYLLWDASSQLPRFENSSFLSPQAQIFPLQSKNLCARNKLNTSKTINGKQSYQGKPLKIWYVVPAITAPITVVIQHQAKILIFRYLLFLCAFVSPLGTQAKALPNKRSLIAVRYA